MKRHLILALMLVLGLSALAAPFRNMEVRLTQPDGQVINCFASGDEFYHYLHDGNGFTIVQAENGYYCYATTDSRGSVVASSFVVGSVDPSSVGLQPFVKISEQEYYAIRQQWEAPLKSKPSTLNQKTFPNGRELNHGRYNNLVVFIRFAGDTYHTSSFSTVDAMFNGTGYGANSLHNFYHHTSYNQLDLWSYFYPEPDGDVILSYEDIYPKEYYQPYNATTNPIGYLDEDRAQREFDLLERAIEYVEDMVPEDLDLDYNDDGMVDNVVFVCKGSTGAWNSLLWPHRWFIYDRYVPLHNLQVYDFNLQLEQGGYFTVSTLCHEMFHSLGAPDLYRYYNDGDPIGSWDLMGSNTEPPQQPSVYMKYQYGNWIEDIPVINPEDPNDLGTYELEANVWEGGRRNGYMISTSDPDQFFFVEYRDKNNYFEGNIPKSGMLIYRIDTRFYGNASYNGNDYYDEVYVFRPGGTFSSDGNVNSANFSQESNRTTFNVNTNPYPFFSDGTIYDWPYQITNVSNLGERISFDLRPLEGEGSGPTPNDFTAHVNRIEQQVELAWSSGSINDEGYNVYCDNVLIASQITDTTFIHPYSQTDIGYHVYKVVSLSDGMSYEYSAPAETWIILGNYETLQLILDSDSPFGAQGGELEVTFSNPALKSQMITLHNDEVKKTELYVPANTEVTFLWHSGFDPDGLGIHLEANRYTEHEQGVIFSIDNPTEGILGTYTVSDNGLGIIAPQNLTATNEGSNVHLHWTVPTENTHFSVFRKGRARNEIVSGYDYVDNSLIRSGSYFYHVNTTTDYSSLDLFDEEVLASVLAYYCEPPINLEGEYHSGQNTLHWDAPQFMGYGLLAYDNNQFEESFGSSSQKWGVKFEPEQLAFFGGHPLVYLEMFDCTAALYTFNIYNGNAANNNTMILSQTQEMTGSGEWVRFPLEEEVTYDASQPIWISVQSTAANNPIPCCAYVNQDNSCYIISGTNWKPVTNFHVYHSWMLRAYTTPINNKGHFSYNLYWGAQDCSDDQMTLGIENIVTNSVVYNSNEDLRFNVTAVINDRETDFSNTILLGPTVKTIEIMEPKTDDFAYINNGNIIINNIDSNIIFQMFDLAGRFIVSRTGDIQSVSTDGMASGVYVLRLISRDNVKTQKIVL